MGLEYFNPMSTSTVGCFRFVDLALRLWFLGPKALPDARRFPRLEAQGGQDEVETRCRKH